MKSKKVILVKAKDPMIPKMLFSDLDYDKYIIIIGNGSYEEMSLIISSENPDIVMIWDSDDAVRISEYVRDLECDGYKPFFIVMTCYRNVYRHLEKCLPENAYPILEPVSTCFLKELIQKAADGEICFDSQ